MDASPTPDKKKKTYYFDTVLLKSERQFLQNIIKTRYKKFVERNTFNLPTGLISMHLLCHTNIAFVVLTQKM